MILLLRPFVVRLITALTAGFISLIAAPLARADAWRDARTS